GQTWQSTGKNGAGVGVKNSVYHSPEVGKIQGVVDGCGDVVGGDDSNQISPSNQGSDTRFIHSHTFVAWWYQLVGDAVASTALHGFVNFYVHECVVDGVRFVFGCFVGKKPVK